MYKSFLYIFITVLIQKLKKPYFDLNSCLDNGLPTLRHRVHVISWFLCSTIIWCKSVEFFCKSYPSLLTVQSNGILFWFPKRASIKASSKFRHSLARSTPSVQSAQHALSMSPYFLSSWSRVLMRNYLEAESWLRSLVDRNSARVRFCESLVYSVLQFSRFSVSQYNYCTGTLWLCVPSWFPCVPT